MLMKYPNSTQIRLLFALFLLDIVKTKQLALNEIDSLLNENPSLEQQFQCYRYRSVVEQEIISASTNKKAAGAGNSTINELSLHGFIIKFEQNLLQSANQYSELWSQVLENQPDLTKIAQIGIQIQETQEHIQSGITTILSVEQMVPSLMRMYAMYLRDILQDMHESDQILAQLAHYLEENKNAGETKSAGQMMDISQEPQAIMQISGGNRRRQLAALLALLTRLSRLSRFSRLSRLSRLSHISRLSRTALATDQMSLGQVDGLNMQACQLVGYQKIELIGRNVKILMPSMYAQHHDEFLENYLTSLEARFMGQNMLLPLKKKSGYIEMVVMRVGQLYSQTHGLQFQASLIPLKTL